MNSTTIDRELHLLLRKLYSERGLDAHHYRESYVQRRVATRLRALQIDNYRDYRQLLDCDTEEYNRLINALTINVTEFFRDKPVWEFFEKHVLPELAARKMRRKQRLIRVWSAGCAGGEEPYSISMAMGKALAKYGSELNVSIYATDLDENSLEAARSATYPKKEMRSVPSRFRDHCILTDEDEFTIDATVRSRVKFRRLDLFADKPIAAVDVIFCRNVLIYFDRAQQGRIFAGFHTALNRDGYLIIGKSEKIGTEMTGHFEPLSSREKIYRRRG